MPCASAPAKPTTTRSDQHPSIGGLHDEKCVRAQRRSRVHHDRARDPGYAGLCASGLPGAQGRRGGHRLDDLGHRTRADDEHPGPRAVLLRHGPKEERARHHGADVGRGGARLDPLGGDRLQPGVQRRSPCDRHVRSRHAARPGHELDPLSSQDHPGSRVHDLPANLRGDHRGAGRRRGRRSHAVLGLSLVRARLDPVRIRSDRALGVGRRLPAGRRRARFRGWHRRASERRHCRPGRGLHARRSARLRQREPCALRSVARGDRHRTPLGRLVRLQRRLSARRQFARRLCRRRHPPRRQRRRADVDVPGMVGPRQAVGARHDLRRGRGSRHDHASVRLRRAVARHRHRRRRRRVLLLGLHQAQAKVPL